jgi:soluble lytic murein transglycosylase-like protein
MLGDRTAGEVSAAFAQQAAPQSSKPQLCPWPIVCATPAPVATGKLRLDAYAAEIETASAMWGVDSVLVRALIHAESAFNPKALSPKGAQGLMQLMPATAERFAVADPFDPAQNINGGVQYLAWLLNRFSGDTVLATAAYNAGEGAVDRYGGIPPYRETEQYVVRVESLAARYRAALGIAATPDRAPTSALLATNFTP